MSSSHSENDLALAEELFSSRLEEIEEGAAGVMEELCAAHPEHARHFEELYQKWKRTRQLRHTKQLHRCKQVRLLCR